MDTAFKELVKQLKDIESKFRSYVDMPEDARARKLDAGIRRLISDAESQKKPRSLEDQVKQLIQVMEEALSESDEMMDYRHLKDLQNRLEDIRAELRKM